jgi:DNA-binding PadR family transcriptional regulator
VLVENELTANELCIVALLMDKPGHGWRLSELLDREGEVGAIWSVARPLVYTSLRRLDTEGYIESAGLERGRRGPHRVNYAPTKKGRAAVRKWLADPVDHVRDVRSLFLLKVVLSKRLRLDVESLLVAQRALLTPFVTWLEARLDDVDPATEPAEEAVLWFRLATARTTVGFIDHLLDSRVPVVKPASRRRRAPS